MGSASDSLPDDIASIYVSIINGGRVKSLSDLLPLSASLQYSDKKNPLQMMQM